MKKLSYLLLAALMLGSVTVQAMTKEEAETECKAQAADDGVSADEMGDYIKECVDALMSAE